MRVFVIFEKNHDCENIIVSISQLSTKLGVKQSGEFAILPFIALVAQLVEQQPFKPTVTGSIPVGGIIDKKARD
jgi:hypothetical protein